MSSGSTVSGATPPVQVRSSQEFESTMSILAADCAFAPRCGQGRRNSVDVEPYELGRPTGTESGFTALSPRSDNVNILATDTSPFTQDRARHGDRRTRRTGHGRTQTTDGKRIPHAPPRPIDSRHESAHDAVPRALTWTFGFAHQWFRLRRFVRRIDRWRSRSSSARRPPSLRPTCLHRHRHQRSRPMSIASRTWRNFEPCWAPHRFSPT